MPEAVDPTEPRPDPAGSRAEAPFPWVLLVLAAAMAFGALSTELPILRWGAIASAIVLGAAALYQARPAVVPPAESPEGPSDDELPPVG